MNRAVSGTVSISGSGRPLAGMQVVAVRLIGGEAVLLGVGASGDMGRFRVEYPALEGPADITVLIVSPKGQVLFTEPVHREIAGAELQINVQVPRGV